MPIGTYGRERVKIVLIAILHYKLSMPCAILFSKFIAIGLRLHKKQFFTNGFLNTISHPMCTNRIVSTVRFNNIQLVNLGYEICKSEYEC